MTLKRVAGLVVAAALAAPAVPVAAAPSPARAAVGVDPVATNLAFPAAFTFFDDGRILYGERFTGQIRIFDPATSSDTLFFTVPNLSTVREQGLLGLAIHPDHPTQPYVYAYVTQLVGTKKKNRIVRIQDAGGTGTGSTVIHETRAAGIHNGGVIHFGPDGMLWAVVGDLSKPANAQNLGSRAGKVLRMTPTGGAPGDNPFAGSVVWSYGHRNMFGFAFDPETDDPWVTENGPSCNDEVNRPQPGANHGWGKLQSCSSGTSPTNTNNSGPNPVLPLVWYTPTIAPTGAAFCDGCGLSAAEEGTFLFGAWKDGMIRRLTLTADRLGVASQAVIYDHPSGVLAVEAGPDGTVYLSDATGIYRLVP